MLAAAATASAPRPEVHVRPERPEDSAAVGRLIADAFGPGRYAKAAERLREGRSPLLDLSLVAWEGERIVGCVRLWRIHIGATPALLLGPFAVASGFRKRGLGAALIEGACLAAAAAGHGIILLVGDAPFFERLGFEAVEKGRATLPGPVNQHRVMWRALVPGALEGVGGPVAV